MSLPPSTAQLTRPPVLPILPLVCHFLRLSEVRQLGGTSRTVLSAVDVGLSFRHVPLRPLDLRHLSSLPRRLSSLLIRYLRCAPSPLRRGWIHGPLLPQRINVEFGSATRSLFNSADVPHTIPAVESVPLCVLRHAAMTAAPVGCFQTAMLVTAAHGPRYKRRCIQEKSPILMDCVGATLYLMAALRVHHRRTIPFPSSVSDIRDFRGCALDTLAELLLGALHYQPCTKEALLPAQTQACSPSEAESAGCLSGGKQSLFGIHRHRAHRAGVRRVENSMPDAKASHRCRRPERAAIG